MAVKYGHRDIVELLLSKEVEVNDIASQAYIRTALYLAINRDYSDVFNVLVTHIVDVNKKIDQNDNTLLHYAVSCGQKDMVELLLAKEAEASSAATTKLVLQARSVQCERLLSKLKEQAK